MAGWGEGVSGKVAETWEDGRKGRWGIGCAFVIIYGKTIYEEITIR